MSKEGHSEEQKITHFPLLMSVLFLRVVSLTFRQSASVKSKGVEETFPIFSPSVGSQTNGRHITRAGTVHRRQLDRRF